MEIIKLIITDNGATAQWVGRKGKQFLRLKYPKFLFIQTPNYKHNTLYDIYNTTTRHKWESNSSR